MNLFRLFALAVLAALFSASVTAQQGKVFEPQWGQQGKDVIWVPTPEELVDRMLRMAQTKADDIVIDLGAGDGRTVIAAAKKFGARSLGIEYNPDMVQLSQKNAEKAGVADKARFVQGDIFATDFREATVLTMYLLPALNLKLRPTILSMKPGTRVVSHAFTMEQWEPDETSSVGAQRAYLWIVPTNVQGDWKLSLASGENYDLTLEQSYQKIRGHVKLGAVEAGLRDARLSGPDIGFAFTDNVGVRRVFTGRVNGSTLEGSLHADNGRQSGWSATKR